MSKKNNVNVEVVEEVVESTEVSTIDNMVASTYADSDILKNAIRNRAGDTHIAESTDSDGNTYLKATYEPSMRLSCSTPMTMSSGFLPFTPSRA